MAKRKTTKNMRANAHVRNIMISLALCFCLVIMNILYVMATHTHIWSGHNVLDPAIRSSIVNTSIEGVRGNIYDRNHSVIAEETPAYTIVAMLDTRTEEEKTADEENRKVQREALLEQAKADGTYEQTTARLEKQDTAANLQYITDPEAAANGIASVLGDLVNADAIESTIEDAIDAGRSQTELGTGTKRIDKASKEAIEALAIPGISFISATKRSYPTTPYSSNLVGFASYNEESEAIQGVLGLEKSMNEFLSGEDGQLQFQQTLNGEVLPGTTKTLQNASDGSSVVLTIDSTLQQTVEEQMQITMANNNASKAWCLVMEVETGKVLAWASYPTFDQNTHMEIPSYIDNVSQMVYEPGSVMKPFVYAAAMDAGVYPYNTQYRAGSFSYDVDEEGNITRLPLGSTSNNPIIRDALGTDYGVLTFEEGLAHSSNVGICELLSSYLDKDTFDSYLDRFGFGKYTDIPYVDESAGTINTEDAASYLSSGFGQATSVTVLELAQAYSALFNDGVMMKPYVVDTITDSAGNVIEKHEPEAVGTPVSANTANQVKDIMRMVLEPGMSGERFAIDGVEMTAKTGTGEVYRPELGAYDSTYYTSSIMAAAPATDPKIMVYWGMESANYLNYSSEPFKTIMKAALIADNVSGGTSRKETEAYEKWESYEMPSLINHSTDYAAKKMEGKKVNTVVLGDGGGIVDQFPKAGTTINSNDNVLLLTDGAAITMPEVIGWTLKDLTAFWQLTGISIQTDGYGKVVWQSVEPGTPIQADTQISVSLE